MTPKRTRKVKEKGIRCKGCGQVINPTETPPSSTWTLTSPMPDKQGRITLTVMGSFTCPRCSKNVKAAMKKIKSDDESSGKSKKEVLMETLLALDKKTSLEEISTSLKMNQTTVGKALSLLIKRGEVQGKIEDNYFVP
ncbi:MAG: hypothetical protein ACXAC7_13310 [Candidatus Hodarchaeales archaeon]|jgi:hypothetical protein